MANNRWHISNAKHCINFDQALRIKLIYAIKNVVSTNASYENVLLPCQGFIIIATLNTFNKVILISLIGNLLMSLLQGDSHCKNIQNL